MRQASFATGWSLIALMIFLAMYNSRKRFSMIPLGKASTWLFLHVAGGLLGVGLFWMHTGGLWPKGNYEQVLALLFYLVSLSGVVGWLLQMIYPRLLSTAGVEVIYERIPAELAHLREQAQALILAANSETLGQYYHEQIHWFLRQPRFFFYHVIGSDKPRAWTRRQREQIQRYLNSQEKQALDQLSGMVNYKLELDVHYALQSVMKRWLLVHVPLAAALLLLAFWHIVVVFVYAG